jgi:hypothetical protein
LQDSPTICPRRHIQEGRRLFRAYTRSSGGESIPILGH